MKSRSNEIRLDGQVAMAAVHEDGELNFLRSPEIVQCIHRGADRASAEQHVIHQHHGLAGHVEWNHGGMNGRRRALVEVIAVHGNIQRTGRHRLTPDAAEQSGQAFCQGHAAALDAHEDDVAADIVAFVNLVRDARERTLDGGGVEDDGGFRHGKGKIQIPNTKLQGSSKFQASIARARALDTWAFGCLGI
jgi:hypothetical protein